MAFRDKKRHQARIYLIDELKHHYDEVMEKYDRPEKYRLQAYTSEHRFFQDLERDRPPATAAKVLIYVANRHLTAEDPLKDLLRFLDRLNSMSTGFEVIVVTSQKMEEAERRLREAGVFSIIPDNENALLRIDNFIKASISRHTIRMKKQAARTALKVFTAYLLLTGLLWFAARMLYPEFF